MAVVVFRRDSSTMQALEDYNISPVTGCLLRQPTTPPPSLLPYKKFIQCSHEILKCGQIREEIEKLPPLDTSQLTSLEERLLAHKLLSFLAAQYVWGEDSKNPAEILPAVIAVPLMEVSIELGCQPLLGHCDLVLSNCFPEKTKPGDRQSFYTEFLPSDERNWLPFIELTADVELSFCDAAKIMMHIINAMKKKDIEGAVECLNKLAEVISIMREQLMLLMKALDAKAFFCEMRPYLSGWSQGKISKGLVYEGVPDSVLTGAEIGGLTGETIPKKRVYMGASAGQSIALQSLDAFLGIEHLEDTKEFFQSMRKYMIREHRHFIEDLKRHTHLRDFVLQTDSQELTKAYNGCVEEVAHFRRDHIKIVSKFIIEPSKVYAPKVEGLGSKGTGGARLGVFLERVLVATEATVVKS